MALDGIDVASWDAGIDVKKVPSDFVIVKATGGKSYKNPEFDTVVRDTIESGKLLGIYHFAGDGYAGSAQEEANHFLEVFRPYIGKAIPILDWEAEATSWDISWAREWLDIVAEGTGATPWFYSYSNYVNSHDCSSIVSYPLWIAAYYAGYQEMGYQENPPLYGGTGDWADIIAYQYSSSGKLPYWEGDLDISKFYGDENLWKSMQSGSIDPSPSKDDEARRIEEEALRAISTPNEGGEVFRLYDINSGSHMFTSNAGEREHLLQAGWNDEGIGWKFPPTPNVIYRMYNPNNGDHLFTQSFEEAQNCQNAGWYYEGANFSSGKEDGIPVYRLYNENNGHHMFVTSSDERSNLLSKGWKDEGIAFYGIA